MIRGPIGEPTKDKILRLSQPDIGSGCWIWRAAIGTDGYGCLSVGGNTLKAHRVSYETFNGPIPTGIFVCHRCDVRRCVNPDHLFLGTNSDNVSDMMTKSRQCLGENNGQSKLTKEKVLAIVEEYKTGSFTQAELGAKYGVNRSAVSLIVSGKRWKHL